LRCPFFLGSSTDKHKGFVKLCIYTITNDYATQKTQNDILVESLSKTIFMNPVRKKGGMALRCFTPTYSFTKINESCGDFE
jgi:hypothetical protein